MQKSIAEQNKQGLASRGFGNAMLLLVLTMVFWAGNSVVGRGAAGLVPPLTLTWLRWTFAAMIILPFAWPHLKRDMPVIRAKWPTLLLIGTIGPGIFITLYYIGLSKTTAINAVIINSAVPILIPIAVFALFREVPSRLQVAGIAISTLGVVAVLTKGNPAVLATLDLNEGDLWVLTAMIVWSTYTALLRKQPPIHWLSFAAICFCIASVVNFPLFIGEFLYGKRIVPTLEAFMAIAYVSTLPSVVAQIFYIRGVELIGSSRAGVFMHLVPFFGAILAITFLGESLYLYHLGGFVLILSGVWLASRPGRGLSLSTK
jgi:drug/metabolite transporter (DMT)-like permease